MFDNLSLPQPILLVDDEESVLLSTRTLLETSGISRVETFQDGREIFPFLENHGASLIVLDLMMPTMPGTEVLEKVMHHHPHIPVVVMSATQELETAVRCMRKGAFDYLVKPVDKSRFLTCVQRALELRQLREEVRSLRSQLFDGPSDRHEAFAAMVTRSPKMDAVFHYAKTVATSPEPVLVVGETGVGKELLVSAIHKISGLSGPLVALNVAGLDETSFTDTLFGHKKGAFTGADQNRQGLIAKAHDGTLFLDEFGDLSHTLQLKLLRLLQERKYYPLGSDLPRTTNARFICATNRNLEERIDSGAFRADLYYRLSGHQLKIPPLRDRTEDLPLLVAHFLQEAARTMGHDKAPATPKQLVTLLTNHPFPGNIRELRGMVFDAMARHTGGTLSMQSFQEAILSSDSGQRPATIEPSEEAIFHHLPDPLPTFQEAETALLKEALQRCDHNQSMAATLLGTSRQTLNRKLKKLKEGR
ncbi:MAG: sigma-54-dependent Fis family transcriptional regulator [Magnetococcales bacterium]|nr:sigma-54-dependent Fis family transcriptional regulator [Magnetococcales bacterium]